MVPKKTCTDPSVLASLFRVVAALTFTIKSLQSNPVYKVTEGAMGSVHINEMSS